MVPVLDKNKKPLMPCSEKRARRLLEKREAKPYWIEHVFCIILQREPKTTYQQDICIGIDPGSKFNGYSVKSEAHTLLNMQVNAVTSVKKKVEERAMLRRGRRGRKTPYRKCRFNRKVGKRIPPSTKARWLQHINIIKLVGKMYSVRLVSLEDIKAKTIKGARKWNVNFSPLEVGKKWFSEKIEELGISLYSFQGFETHRMRQVYNFKKNSDKSKEDFYTHAMDAWCLSNEVIGGHITIDNERTMYLKPLMYHRRKLHEVLPKKKGFRRSYGGTLSQGIKRGTLVIHPKWGRTIVGGCGKLGISLHAVDSNRRVCQNAKKEVLRILTKTTHIKR